MSDFKNFQKGYKNIYFNSMLSFILIICARLYLSVLNNLNKTSTLLLNVGMVAKAIFYNHICVSYIEHQ